MAATEEILGQFLGDETFPVNWASDVEKGFFWVYDDLHIPHPVSPMFFDIGGWWLSCDHMFRRFGTPFAVDWLAKNVNGYVYTTAVPADPGAAHRRHRVRRATARGCRGTPSSARHGQVPRHGAAGLRRAVRGLVARPARAGDAAQLRLPRGAPRRRRRDSLAEGGDLLEDAIDIHDRHWKIHWMLNFAQLSATLNLRAVMERTRGSVDAELLGRLQNSASDRNWDSIEALWRMKNEVRDDAELRAAFGPRTRARSRGRSRKRARPAIPRRADRPLPARVRLARGLEPRVHLPDRARGDGAGPRP